METSGTGAAEAKRYRLSFQLYSSRNFPPVEDQLVTLARLGFDGVESYPGAYGEGIPGFRAKLDALELKCFTAHLPYDRFTTDRDGVIADALALGLETVIAPNLSLDKRPSDVAGWTRIGQTLAAHADALARRGLKLGWHNHDFEYAALPDGSRPIDAILQPGVLFEPDIGMMVKAGADPAAEIARYAGQVVAVHAKDFTPVAGSSEIGWTDIGSGKQDWDRIWAALAKSPCDLLVCEHDNPSDFWAFAINSSRYLKAHNDGE